MGPNFLLSYTNSLVNTDLSYANFTNLSIQQPKLPFLHHLAILQSDHTAGELSADSYSLFGIAF